MRYVSYAKEVTLGRRKQARYFAMNPTVHLGPRVVLALF